MIENIQILEDVEEALAREVRRITFWDRTQRKDKDGAIREMHSPFTGELVRKPIEPRFYDDAAEALQATSPRFTISLLKLYEDLNSKRTVPAIGNEDEEVLPGPEALFAILGSHTTKTTDGGTSSTVELSHRRIRNVTTDHVVRIKSGENKGTYRIEDITLVGNGPHTITLSPDLAVSLPAFIYTPTAGIVKFKDFVDLSAVKAGDELVDVTATAFVITAVNVDDASLAVAPGSALANGSGASITRTGDVLQNDDSGEDQNIMILDPSQPVANKGSRYRSRSWPIPYDFIYYIKISTRERDDHIRVADRMMQVFNPPRGQIFVVVRTDHSAESKLTSDIEAGNKTVFVEDATCFYANDTIRLFDNLGIGEELTIESINVPSKSITFVTAPAQSYTYNNEAKMVSHYRMCTFERDFTNHITEDDVDRQFWVHRFTYKVEAYIDSRIPSYTTNQTYEDTGDVEFVQLALENHDGDVLCDKKVEVP